MNRFDNDNKRDPRNGKSIRSGRSRKFSNREDSGNFDKAERTPFAKDKRPRINRSTSGQRFSKENHEEQRHSFNPNFTKDNKRKDFDRSKKDNQEFHSDYRTSSDRSNYSEFNEFSHRSNRHDNSYGTERSGKLGNNSIKTDNSRHDYNQSGFNKGRKPSGVKRGIGNYVQSKDYYPRFDAPKATGAVRLNRFLANSGICSRREADELISAGVVTVNGRVVSELGSKVNPGDEVRFNGEIVKGEKKVYILMNKPKGFVTSIEDPHADKTVIDIVKGICKERVYPVGRLDKNTVGVLLITNDGELTRQLTHPSSKKKKIYQVTLDKPLTKADMEHLAEGLTLEDGPMYFDEVQYVNDNKKEIGVEIHSGRNRIVRRMFEALGYNVQKLDRVYFAGLTKQKLKRGAWRFLTPREVSILKSGEYE